MFIVSFVFLSIISGQSLVAGDCVSSSANIDGVAAQLFSFGDPCNQFPTDPAVAADLCAKYRNWTAEVDGSISPYFIRLGLTSMYYFSAHAFCRLYEQTPNEMIAFAKEANYESEKLYPARDHILDVAYAVEKTAGDQNHCKQPNGLSVISCLVEKWFAATAVWLSEPSQKIVKQMFQSYLNFATNFAPSAVCPSFPPRPYDTRFRSVDLNYLISSKVCLEGL